MVLSLLFIVLICSSVSSQNSLVKKEVFLKNKVYFGVILDFEKTPVHVSFLPLFILKLDFSEKIGNKITFYYFDDGWVNTDDMFEPLKKEIK